MLAGTATLYTDELDQKKRQVRPNAALANHFEASNREVESPAFQQANVLRGVNDRIVTVCPAPLPGLIVPSGCRSTLSGSSRSSGGSGGGRGCSGGDGAADHCDAGSRVAQRLGIADLGAGSQPLPSPSPFCSAPTPCPGCPNCYQSENPPDCP